MAKNNKSTKSDNYKCSICYYQCKLWGSLIRHMESHKIETSDPSAQVDAETTEQSGTNPRGSHSAEPKQVFSCKVCSKTFGHLHVH